MCAHRRTALHGRGAAQARKGPVANTTAVATAAGAAAAKAKAARAALFAACLLLVGFVEVVQHVAHPPLQDATEQ